MNCPPDRLTVQPACVQIALKARNSPLRSCTSQAASPWLSNCTAWPGATSDALATCRPGRVLAGGLEAGVAPGAVGRGVGVVGVNGASESDEPLPCNARPITALNVAATP